VFTKLHRELFSVVPLQATTVPTVRQLPRHTSSCAGLVTTVLNELAHLYDVLTATIRMTCRCPPAKSVLLVGVFI